MKKLFFLLFLLPTVCFAKGTLSFENRYFFDSQQVGPVLGLLVEENLLYDLGYSSWTGGGLGVNEKWWVMSRNDLELSYNKLTFFVGFTYLSTPKNESDLHAGLKVSLW
jgi:hypothetical protein